MLQDFGSRGATRVASVRRCLKFLLCLTVPMPAGSKMDPLLAKAEHISDGGSASARTYLGKGKSYCATQQLQPERGVRVRERNNSADTKVSEEGGARGAPGTGAEIALQPMEKTMMELISTCGL